MGGIVDGVKTVNSAVRTLLLAILVTTLGLGAFYGYSEYTKRDRQLQEQADQLAAADAQMVSLQGEIATKDAEIVSLGADLQAAQLELERLETSLQLLKTDQRLARINVVGIERDEDGKAVTTTLQFVEMSPQGEPLSEAREFELPGDVVYVDNWIIKFDDKYIENGDIERGTSLCLFRRVFSEEQVPTQGFSLDEVGSRPQAYARGGAVSEFEQKLWTDFWEFANDPEKARKMGIRAANGEAVSIKVQEGKSYSISLRASGGLSIEPSEADGKPEP